MRRTQVYLPDDIWKRLNAISCKESTSIAELIRRAVAHTYPMYHRSRFSDALDAVTGMWADRSDLGSTESYVRELRQSNRLERIAA